MAFVEYEDQRDAEDAAKDMNGRQILGRNVTVEMAKASDSRRHPVGGKPSMRIAAVDIEERVGQLAQQHRLDEAATTRLASVFQDRSRLGCDLAKDFEELGQHLAASNK